MEARKAIENVATECLDSEFLDTRGEFLDALSAGGSAYLQTHFARIPRRVGARSLPPGLISIGDIRLDLGSLRTCDLLAADLLLHSADPSLEAVNLFRQGDAIECRMILRALPFLPADARVESLLIEAHRCNDEG
ncbi:MAG TPA: hypothetical protein PKA37_17030, partial [Planctomycetota bacterium]|nr:hypothetical protein [Planctomycetota bacterium]